MSANPILTYDPRTHELCAYCFTVYPRAQMRDWWDVTWTAAYEGDDGCYDPSSERICATCHAERVEATQRASEAIARGERVLMVSDSDLDECDPFAGEVVPA